MKISILIDQKDNFFHEFKSQLKDRILKKNRKLKFVYNVKKLKKGDFLFIIGTNKILNNCELKLHAVNINIHPSKLPKGRGSAAVSWNILNGKNFFYITLHEAIEKFDSGDIFYQEKVEISKYDLCDDIRRKQALKIINLINKFLNNHKNLRRKKQIGKATYLRKRKPEDSEINFNKSLKSQINLLRIVDNERYPAFFKYGKYKYFMKIYKK